MSILSNFRKPNWYVFLLAFGLTIHGKTQTIVPIISYTTNLNGQVNIVVNSSPDQYYLLRAKHHIDSAFTLNCSLTMGQMGTTILTESLRAYPENHYQVVAYSANSPGDIDGDGTDDLTEMNAMPAQNPLNFAETIDFVNGQVGLDSYTTFSSLAVLQNDNPWIPYLNGKEYVKFIIYAFPSSQRKIFFINTNTHDLHESFANYYGVSHLDPNVIKGQIIFHPTVIASNGTLGTYSFNYTNNESKSFAVIQQTQELLARNMQFLANNLSYYVTTENEDDFNTDIDLFSNSRVSVLFENDVYAGLNYWGLNQKEGYGFFRHINAGDSPGPKDIVLYDYLPNTLPRVSGIITSVIQTPLSHVNLRAVHDEIPNAFIRDPLENDTLFGLLNHYVYFKVEQSNYVMREATLDEVNDWFEKNRPPNEQIPPLNLDYTQIKPLDHITFDMYDGYGAKSANVATMRRFGFPEGTIPDGFGVPFSFYQEFMQHNHLFDEIRLLMQTPHFDSDRELRDSLLTLFRAKIELGTFPSWMLRELLEMQNAFPHGQAIRCRSTTNNEDLPGFSGAGLYDSRTHHPGEGNITKTIKEIYASLWNLRAFEERDYFRINHFYASMGVLCHPNFENEKVNGVGVSTDPIYNTENTFYLNSQLGEELITNPGNSKPEELVLYETAYGPFNYLVIQNSSLVGPDSVLMSDAHLDQLRSYLQIIHDQFAILYHAENNETFAMDIEYKITEQGLLVIKQARPWISYIPQASSNLQNAPLLLFPNPAKEIVHLTCEECGITAAQIVDYTGRTVLEKVFPETGSSSHPILIENLPIGIYLLKAYRKEELLGIEKLIIR